MDNLLWAPLSNKIKKIQRIHPKVVILSNRFELINLHYSGRYQRTPVKGYDSSKHMFNMNLTSVVTGHTKTYHNNWVDLASLSNHMPIRSRVACVKMIGPGETVNGKVMPYISIEKVLVDKNNCTVQTYYDYFSWNENPGDTSLLDLIDQQSTDQTFDVVFCMEFSMYAKFDSRNELASLERRRKNIQHSLDMLSKGGDLWVEFFQISHQKTLDLLISIRKQFRDIEFIRSELYEDTWHGGFWVYRGFKEHTPCSLHSIKKDMLEYARRVSKNIKTNLSAFIERCEYNEIMLKKKARFEQTIKNQLTVTALNWCKTNNISISRFYKEKLDKLPRPELLQKLFPFTHKIRIDRLQITNESLYSMSMPREADMISRVIRRRFGGKKIIDATANVGGNTLSFASHFKQVVSCEYDEDTFKCLKNNVDVYQLDNVRVIHGSAVDFKNSEDPVFYDPPWGGIWYKMEKSTDLWLYGKTRINVVSVLAKNFCMKVPTNYRFESLMCRFTNIKIKRVGKFLLVHN